MQIAISNVAQSTFIIIAFLLAALLLTLRKSHHTDLLPISVTQELKGLGMLSIVFAHIGYNLVTDSTFLYPLTVAAGVGVDLFLFMSGYGLTVTMLKKPLPALRFYQRRMIKVFIPFWLVLIAIFIADALILHRFYPAEYMLRSLLGWFPHADVIDDVNSPFWYITWMLMFYVLYPLLFLPQRPWLTALLLAAIANILTIVNPLDLQDNWLHHLHTYAFSLGMLMAWLFQGSSPAPNPLVERLKTFRQELAASTPLFYLILLFCCAVLAGYMTSHKASTDWPRLAAMLTGYGFNSGVFIEQLACLIAMMALIVLFSLKKRDCLFLYTFGVYSYETYLLHWPLLSRYDLFYHYMPAWLATIIWLITFLGMGWGLQKVTQHIDTWMTRGKSSITSVHAEPG
jgi:peptidoglycan/LPS O-acetylase OafA/YrhL